MRFALLGLWWLFATPVHASENDFTPWIRLARESVKEDRWDRTTTLGQHDLNHQYWDVPKEGGILIGMDVVCNTVYDRWSVAAIRPYWRTAQGDGAGEWLGSNRRPGNPGTSFMKFMAPLNYAVGGVRIRDSFGVAAFGLTYFPLTNKGLDLQKPRESDWFGAFNGNPKSSWSQGKPVMGVYVTAQESIQSVVLFTIPNDKIPAVNVSSDTKPASPPLVNRSPIADKTSTVPATAAKMPEPHSPETKTSFPKPLPVERVPARSIFAHMVPYLIGGIIGFIVLSIVAIIASQRGSPPNPPLMVNPPPTAPNSLNVPSLPGDSSKLPPSR